MNEHDRRAIDAFFNQMDESGETNASKATRLHKVIRRVPSTSKEVSFEEVSSDASNASDACDTSDAARATDASESDELPVGAVVVDDKLVGFGIHILNQDVYPLQSFEIYLRGCELTGHLDLSSCHDLVFVDVYHNRISSVDVSDAPNLRILGLQDNDIAELDVSGLPACQGIDAGSNHISCLDVSRNYELVELYVNGNNLSTLDLSANTKLKYLYCQGNRLTTLDTTKNPLLRHLDATGNPLVSIRALAPQRDDMAPLELSAEGGGTVGMRFNPVYDAQWKETGVWEQAYCACPNEGWRFVGWFDEGDARVCADAEWVDEYGASRVLVARFEPQESMREVNTRLIERRLEEGLAYLREHYEVNERALDEVFRVMDIGGRPHEPRSFDVEGVGNLLMMTVKDSDEAQLSSFVLTPYCKNLPLFSTDFVYTGDKRFFLVELYDLGNVHDEAFEALIARFAELQASWSDVPDMPVRPCWYDAIRPVCIAKMPDAALDERALNFFLQCLEVFVDAAQTLEPFATEEARVRKWQATKTYSDRLIDEGGVSTDLFTRAIGAANTRRYFDEVFFAPVLYQ